MKKSSVIDNKFYNVVIMNSIAGNLIAFDSNFNIRIEQLKHFVQQLEADNTEHFFFELNDSWMLALSDAKTPEFAETYHKIFEECFKLIKNRKLYISFNNGGYCDKYVEMFEDMVQRHPTISGLIIEGRSFDYFKIIQVLHKYPQIDSIVFNHKFLDFKLGRTEEILTLIFDTIKQCLNIKHLSFSEFTFNASDDSTIYDNFLKEISSLYFINEIYRYGSARFPRRERYMPEITERNRARKKLIYDATLTYLMIAKRQDSIVSIAGKDVNLVIAKLIYNHLSSNEGIKHFIPDSNAE